MDFFQKKGVALSSFTWCQTRHRFFLKVWRTDQFSQRSPGNVQRIGTPPLNVAENAGRVCIAVGAKSSCSVLSLSLPTVDASLKSIIKSPKHLFFPVISLLDGTIYRKPLFQPQS